MTDRLPESPDELHRLTCQPGYANYVLLYALCKRVNEVADQLEAFSAAVNAPLVRPPALPPL